MKNVILISVILVVGILISGFVFNSNAEMEQEKLKSFHDFTVKTIDGNDYDLSQLKGKKVLVVNTASKCGLTPQYKVLQNLYEKLDKSKFEIIGFPANNFLSQEPGSNSDIKAFCTKNYGVTFPMMSKVSVCDYIYKSHPPTSENATKTSTHELYKWLTNKELNGVADSEITWNFQKFLIDENGKLIGSISPKIGKELLYMQEWLMK